MKQKRSRFESRVENSRGVIIGEEVTIDSFTIHEALSPKEQAHHSYKLGLRHLEQKDYPLAEKAFRESRETAQIEADAAFYLALSILAGRPPRALKLPAVRELETILGATLQQSPPRAHHLLLLALVKHDYYLRSGLDVPPPTHRSLLEQVARCRPDPDKIYELLDHLPQVGGPVYTAIQGYS